MRSWYIWMGYYHFVLENIPTDMVKLSVKRIYFHTYIINRSTHIHQWKSEKGLISMTFLSTSGAKYVIKNIINKVFSNKHQKLYDSTAIRYFWCKHVNMFTQKYGVADLSMFTQRFKTSTLPVNWFIPHQKFQKASGTSLSRTHSLCRQRNAGQKGRQLSSLQTALIVNADISRLESGAPAESAAYVTVCISSEAK